MDSASALPEPGAFGRSLAHRMTPQVTVIRRAVVQPGFIARRSIAFGSYVGQSQVSRWSIGATMSRGTMAVRPPIDYWPWSSAEEPEPVAVPRMDRSLPRAKLLRRSGQPDPGAIVKSMRPEPIDLATRGQAKAPKRNDMQSFKAMLERTGRLPAGDGSAPIDERPRGAMSAPAQPAAAAAVARDRAAAAKSQAPGRATSPAPTPRAVAPGSAAAPRGARSAAPATLAPAAPGGAAGVGRSQPSPARALRPNPFDQNDEPGPTLRRSLDDAPVGPTATPPSTASGAFPAAAAGRAAADDTPMADLPVSPVWPGAIEVPNAPNAPQERITARRAAEQLRSARGPRPLPAVIAPSIEQVAPRRWGTNDTIDAGELAQQLLSRQASRPQSAPPEPTPATAAPDSSTPEAHPTERVDAATAPVAPAAVQRAIAGADDTDPAVVRRSTDGATPPTTVVRPATPAAPLQATGAPLRPAATALPQESTRGRGVTSLGDAATTSAVAAQPAPRPATQAGLPAASAPDRGANVPPSAGEHNDVVQRAAVSSAPATTASDAIAHAAAQGTTAASPVIGEAVAPPAALAPRRSPVGPSMVLPGGEPTTPPRPDHRERARQLPASATTEPTGPGALGATAAPEATISAVSQRMLARPLSPQPPDLAMPAVVQRSLAADATVRPTATVDSGPSVDSAPSDGRPVPARPVPARPVLARPSDARLAPQDVDDQRHVDHGTTALPLAPPAYTTPAPTAAAANTPTPTEAGRRERPVPPARPTPDRFLEVLQAAPTPPARRLPTRFATLARSIAGDAPVQVRHDVGARAALAAVGKRAATIGDTILLDAAPTAAAMPVLAHELTHVANPTMAPRFYDDERQTVEERRADAVAQLIQRSPSLLSATPATPLGSTQRSLSAAASLAAATPPATAAPPSVVRRSAEGASLPPPPPQRASVLATNAPAVRPMAPLDSPSGRARSGSDSTPRTAASQPTTVRRSTASPTRSTAKSAAPAVIRRSPAGSTAAPTAATSSTIRRALTDDSADSGVVAHSAGDTPQPQLPPIIAAMTTTGGQLDFVDWIVEQVEDRVVAEFQRRGGRFREDF